MMLRNNTITAALASAALLLSTAAPQVFASTNLSISGNGSRSDNTISVSSTNRTSVNQTNDTSVSNDVSIRNNTGFNSASDNTSGNVRIDTGNASARVDISNQGGMNIARLNSCGCDGNLTARISGNGYRSDNSIDYNANNSQYLNQRNYTDFSNTVDVSNNTGYNSADNNTGGVHLMRRLGNTWWMNPFWYGMGGSSGGNVSLRTGDANARVMIDNAGSVNRAY